MNLKKKFVIGAASVALVAGMGGVAAPAAVADPSLPGSIMKLERLGGLDRVQTSLKVAKAEFGKMGAKRLYIVSAAEGNMVDAATAGMLTDGPIVFVYNNSYVATAVGKDVLANIPGIKEVVAIGGDGVISDNTLNAVKDAMKVKKTSRLAGKDRYATSVAIADYLYTQSIKGDKNFANRTSGSGNFLKNAYLANGANEHVVDSMVAGTLDDGAILLVQPDGKIPEVVAEFIKKALPTQFSALGGTGAVSDATVNEAWVIKALGNKWETSYSIPNLREKIEDLEWLVNGYSKNATGTNLSDKQNFAGLKRVVEVAESNSASWANKVANEKQQITNWFVNNSGKTRSQAYAAPDVNNALKNLYGSTIANTLDDDKYFELDDNTGDATGVNYEAIEATKAYKDLVEDATKQLDKVWADEKHQGEITNAVAKASQLHVTKAGSVADKFAAIAEVAKYTVDNDKKWLETSEKQLASLKGEWRGEFDKIAPKTVQRFGGKDRFETAQLIANWYAKDDYKNVTAAYIANGTRLADSLAAGQLTGGPILLVRNDTKIPEFTANVATHLLCWKGKPIKVSAIGGTGVVSDDVLSTMVNLIGTKSVCKVKSAKSTTPTLVASPKAPLFRVGDTDPVYVTVDNTTTKAAPQMATGFPKVVDKDGTASNVFTVKAANPATTTDGEGNIVNNYEVAPRAGGLQAGDKTKAPYKVLFKDVEGNTTEIKISIDDALLDLSTTDLAVNATAGETTAITLKLDENGTDLFASADVDLTKLTVKKVVLGAQTLPTDTVSVIDGDPGQNGKIKLKFKAASPATGAYFVVLHYADATGANDVEIRVNVA